MPQISPIVWPVLVIVLILTIMTINSNILTNKSYLDSNITNMKLQNNHWDW